MLKIVLAATSIALIAAFPATGGAAGGGINTDVEIEDTTETTTQLIVVGNILAPNKCQKFRPMELISDGNVIDEGPSSRRGSWALAFEDKAELGDVIKVKALRSTAGNDTCKADTQLLVF